MTRDVAQLILLTLIPKTSLEICVFTVNGTDSIVKVEAFDYAYVCVPNHIYMGVIADFSSVEPLSFGLRPYMCAVLHIYMGVLADHTSVEPLSFRLRPYILTHDF